MIHTLLLSLLVFGPPNEILATDPRVHPVGRFDSPGKGQLRGAWSNTALTLRVEGKILEAKIANEGDNFVQVEVDGQETQAWKLRKGPTSYKAELRGGPHTVRLVKRTEAFVGPITFLSLKTDGKFLQAKALDRRIEVIGDSISCGFGNEGKAKEEPFSPATENANMTYEAIAARDVGAEVTTIAWSGRKMWPDNTMPEIFGKIIPTEEASAYTFKGTGPQAVIVHLATNDFGKDNPDQTKWCAAYVSFLKKVRGYYPKARLYCAMGSMMSDNWPPEHKALTTLRDYISTIVNAMHMSGDSNVTSIEFEVQQESDGIGSSWHPSIKTHRIMAAKLAAVLRADLGW